jgi:integrase
MKYAMFPEIPLSFGPMLMPSLKPNALLLTKAIKGPKAAYQINGVAGLHLCTSGHGAAVWRIRYRHDGTQRWHTLGGTEKHDYDAAKAWALEKLTALERTGIDPKVGTTSPTLRVCFELWLARHAKKNLRSWKMEERRYLLHLDPALGEKPAEEISLKVLAKVRDDLAARAPIESNRVVALFQRIANWARLNGVIEVNRAHGLPKVGAEKRRERVFTDSEIRILWAALHEPLAIGENGLTEFDAEGLVATRRAVSLLLLTGQRRSEVAAARIANVDLVHRVWTIPAERVGRDREGASKNGLRHTVPLSPMALEVFMAAIESAGRSPFVFPSHKTNSALRGDSITQFLDRNGTRLKIDGLGAHNLRRTVGQRMRIAGVPVDHRAYVLNHVDEAKSKVTSWNYDPGDHDAEKLAALEKWEAALRSILDVNEINSLTTAPLVG